MKRKNMMRRNLSRSIRTSLGRYIAIVAIVALGAGIFCGLKVTKVDMIATVQDYTDRQNMFDLRMVNTYGWKEEDVQVLSQVAGIADAEGSISLDVLARMGTESDDLAFKFLSIPERVNQPSLSAGRMPTAPDECLLDSFFYDEEVIGQTVYISKANEDTTLDALAHDRYTVVGLCGTPLYLNMQRGSTSIGDGALTAYCYIPPEGFDLDVYTEICLTLEGDYAVYTDRYDDAMEDMADVLEEVCQPLAAKRFEDVKKEAEEAYADGCQEYADGMAEYQDAKTDALKQLADAEFQIHEGEQELADKRKLLEDNQKIMEESQSLLDDNAVTLADSRSTLAQSRSDAYAQLADSYAELMSNYKLVLSSQRQVESGLSQVESGITQVENYMTQIESGLSTLEVMLPILDTSIELTQKTLDSALLEHAQGSEVVQELETKLQELKDTRDDYARQKAEAEESKAQCEAQLTELQAKQSELSATKSTLDASLESIELGFMELEQAQRDADNQFASADAQLDAAQAKIDLGQQQLEDGRTQLEEGLAALESGEQELADAKAELETQRQKAIRELSDAGRELKDAEAELADARQEIDEMEDPDVYALTRNTNLGYVVFESDSDIVAGVATIFPAFFLAVAALVCITTMTRMVDEERTQIGVMKALGYGNGAIMSKYLGYSISATLIGCALGILVGSTLFPTIIWMGYRIMYGFTDKLLLSYDPGSIVFLFASYLGLMVLVTWYCCRQALREVPAELMRPKAPSAGKNILLEKLPVWQKLSFLNKVSIRNIFRYRQRLAMMLLGIGGCTALLVTGFGLRDSITGMVTRQFETVSLYDISVSFSDPLSEEEQAQFRADFRDKARQILFCYQGGIDLEYDGSVKNVNFLASDQALDGCWDLHDGEQAIPMPGENEVVLSIGTAATMGIRAGDTVTLRDSDMREMTVTVSGIFDNNVYNYAIISGDTMRDQWDQSPELSTAFVVNNDDHQDVHELGAALSGYDGVLSISINQDIARQVTGMLDALDAIIALIVVFAGLLACTVLYNLTNINIKERIREIATIKVLGFYAGETASYVFKENLTLTVMGTILGLAGGKLLHAAVMSYIRIDMVWFDNLINWPSYLLAAVLTLLAAVVVDCVMFFQLEKINMAEALKSVE